VLRAQPAPLAPIPALTTVRLPLEEMGEHAARLTLLPGSRRTTGRPIKAPGQVILRESTRSVA
jgi:LacI family transcriptional regulator